MNSTPFIVYRLCPECGRPNSEAKGACLVCGTKLMSEDRDGHERYIEYLKDEMKRKLGFLCASAFVFAACVVLLLSLILGARSVPGFAIVGAIVLAAIATYKCGEKYLYLRRFLNALSYEKSA
jgi:uncharacterized membrane protein YvbJ